MTFTTGTLRDLHDRCMYVHCSKGNVGTSEKRGGAHTCFSERTDITWSRAEQPGLSIRVGKKMKEVGAVSAHSKCGMRNTSRVCHTWSD